MTGLDYSLVGIVVALIASQASLFIYLGTRIDRISDRVHGMELRLGRVEDGLTHVEDALTEHAATHARLAHR